jgi:L-lactate dehydrogenase (cytochrome)
MGIGNKYPALSYLAKRAEQRIPFFAWEYLSSGTGAERLISRNRTALDKILLLPEIATGRFTPETKTSLFGKDYTVPFGAGPVGMSGLIWPGAEIALARTARDKGFPYTLSMVANETIEAVAEAGGKNVWFQLYPLKQHEIEDDLLTRARAAGIETLVVTLDVPVGSRRERQLAAGLSVPPKMTPLMLWRVAKRPEWAIATMRRGQPRFRMLETYFDAADMRDSAHMVGSIVDGRPDWNSVKRIRDFWKGNLLVKGIVSPDAAEAALDAGADGIVVSNHGGRQFDAAPASIDVLPKVAERVAGRVPVLFDSGVVWGLDILRAVSRGADFCLLGRGFLYAVAALGAGGGEHAYSILRKDLENNMIQMGARSLSAIQLCEISRSTV